MSLMDYGMCDQTVTVYRRTKDGLARTVLEGCCLQVKSSGRLDESGYQVECPFLLIVPGEEQLVFPGDRIAEGIGPESWQEADACLLVEYAIPYAWEGVFCHTEAGRKG